MTNHNLAFAKLIWRHCVSGSELPFFHKRKGILKIDQPAKMPWRNRLCMRVACSYSSTNVFIYNSYPAKYGPIGYSLVTLTLGRQVSRLRICSCLMVIMAVAVILYLKRTVATTTDGLILSFYNNGRLETSSWVGDHRLLYPWALERSLREIPTRTVVSLNSTCNFSQCQRCT